MTAHIHLGLVFHQHQPVGNYDFVFEEFYAKSYEPLVACLERHPGVSNTEDGVELAPQGWCVVFQADGGPEGGELEIDWGVGT